MTNLKKKIVGTIFALCLLATAGSALAATATWTDWYGTVPSNGGNLVTPELTASGPSQYIKVTYATNNTTLYGTITDGAFNNIGDEEVPLTIGRAVQIDSGAVNNQKIHAMLETSIYQFNNIYTEFSVLN